MTINELPKGGYFGSTCSRVRTEESGASGEIIDLRGNASYQSTLPAYRSKRR
jgi:hypothetical protein